MKNKTDQFLDELLSETYGWLVFDCQFEAFYRFAAKSTLKKSQKVRKAFNSKKMKTMDKLDNLLLENGFSFNDMLFKIMLSTHTKPLSLRHNYFCKRCFQFFNLNNPPKELNYLVCFRCGSLDVEWDKKLVIAKTIEEIHIKEEINCIRMNLLQRKWFLFIAVLTFFFHKIQIVKNIKFFFTLRFENKNFTLFKIKMLKL